MKTMRSSDAAKTVGSSFSSSSDQRHGDNPEPMIKVPLLGGRIDSYTSMPSAAKLVDT